MSIALSIYRHCEPTGRAYARGYSGEIFEIELNPVLVHGVGKSVTIVDALVVKKKV